MGVFFTTYRNTKSLRRAAEAAREVNIDLLLREPDPTSVKCLESMPTTFLKGGRQKTEKGRA